MSEETKSRFAPSLLAAIVCAVAFKGKQMERIQASLVMLAMTGQDVCATDVPDDISENDTHLPGMAIGHLIQANVLTVVGRRTSPDPKARRRKLNVLRITNLGIGKAWLHGHGFAMPEPRQEAPSLVLEVQNG